MQNKIHLNNSIKRIFEEENDDDISDTAKRIKINKKDIVGNIPYELLIQHILPLLSRKDVINLSILSHTHRSLLHSIVFSKVETYWHSIPEFIKNFKHLSKVETIKFKSDLNDKKATNFGEWNNSLKDILSLNNLNGLEMELLTSARCLKYKDDFDVDLSNKIKNLSLISQMGATTGDQNGEAMFELTQLQRFHHVQNLTLKGFSLARDTYFYPKVKTDMSDYKIRRKDGKLMNLSTVTLVNCQWEYPFSLSDVFAPEYPLPGGVISSNKKVSPKSISLFYSGEASKFVESERFKSFVDNEYNKHFMFEIDFFKELKELSIVIVNSNYEKNSFSYYYPRLNLINLKREFWIESVEGMKKQCMISNLEKLKLIGWRLWSDQELDSCFRVGADFQMNMKSVEFFVMRSGNYQLGVLTQSDKNRLNSYKLKLLDIFGEKCQVKVGYIDSCFDGRYDAQFGTKLEL
ncbi:hypothetical protein DAMA08_031490 [Martiniozyma asiatica (nom. inval.)]|nr:hypothetical protein DAMA08_031490 [Martiniozyma asiatica]